MRSALLKAVFATVFALSAYAQTITTTNALGLTVVELITLNPLGLATTETLSTLTGATTRTTTTPLTTTTPTATTTAATQNGGAVEDSPTGGAATQTVYQYSTTDAAGLSTCSLAPTSITILTPC
ncbi:uncharacterized protein B0H18DRAFT_1008810 [Fomitopsis serialis]|uniref:uncharacterized protein n=1 Tax=Fomitopsis serialis TaxID=139415 RepID=UPI002008CBCA|nr:uncharacterized protein B0H18DRAFT_1008810 [Neoantrodia serialis]KAH9925522.1 hypothetical protein B0H18DRAFT_1008810 [Neoantrodia serialis]